MFVNKNLRNVVKMPYTNRSARLGFTRWYRRSLVKACADPFMLVISGYINIIHTELRLVKSMEIDSIQ